MEVKPFRYTLLLILGLQWNLWVKVAEELIIG